MDLLLSYLIFYSFVGNVMISWPNIEFQLINKKLIKLYDLYLNYYIISLTIIYSMKNIK